MSNEKEFEIAICGERFHVIAKYTTCLDEIGGRPFRAVDEFTFEAYPADSEVMAYDQDSAPADLSEEVLKAIQERIQEERAA
jgi:hypothetical protein